MPDAWYHTGMDTTTHDDDNDGPESPTNWEEFISADGEMPYEGEEEYTHPDFSE